MWLRQYVTDTAQRNPTELAAVMYPANANVQAIRATGGVPPEWLEKWAKTHEDNADNSAVYQKALNDFAYTQWKPTASGETGAAVMRGFDKSLSNRRANEAADFHPQEITMDDLFRTLGVK